VVSPRITVGMGSCWLQVASGGFGAKAPPLAARPVVGSIPPKIESSNVYGFELDRPSESESESIKSTKLLYQVIKAIMMIMCADSHWWAGGL